MSAPGVGVIVALTFAAAVDDPGRFRSSKAVGAHFGLTPKKYQSGENDVTGRISKIGDAGVRTMLYEAANVILTRPVKGSELKSWAMRHRQAGWDDARPRWPWRASSRSCCIGCSLTARHSLPKGAPPRRPRQRRKIDEFGRARHQPPGARSRRRDDGSGQAVRTLSGAARPTAHLDWPAAPHQTPSGGGHAPTPDRSETPATGSALKRG